MAVQFMILHTPLGTLLGPACNIIFSLPLIQTQRSYLTFLTPWTSPLNYPMEASNCSPDFPRSGSFLFFISLSYYSNFTLRGLGILAGNYFVSQLS
jgi:hypothetical protein